MGHKLQTLPILERWDCNSCALCCRGHTVLLDPADLARLESQHWEDHPDMAGKPAVVPVGRRDSRPRLNQTADGSCVFLMDNGYCRIHAEHGEAAKPWVCRMFPFQVIPVDKHLRVTMRRNCPTAAANAGRPIERHLPLVRELADHAVPSGKRPAPPQLVAGVRRSWPDALHLMEVLERITLDENRPPVFRLVHGVTLCNLLAQTRLAQLSPADYRAVVEGIDEVAGQLAGAYFADRRPPGLVGRVLFRQSVGDYARVPLNLGVRPPIGHRLRLLVAGYRFAAGRGQVPDVHPELPPTDFADLDRPLGALPAEVVEPIARYVAAACASAHYFGVGRSGWPLVDGYRALALTWPVALVLLRWLATGRAPTQADAHNVVRLLDWSHHYPLLCGRRHRLRLALLSRGDDLQRLLVWLSR